MKTPNNIPKLIGIDGDDTLWYTEIVYDQLNKQVKSLFDYSAFWDDAAFTRLLHSNISIIGYGMKTYCITLLEYIFSETTPSKEQLSQVIELTKNTWNDPITLYPYAEETVKQLSARFPVILVTQGDSSEQSSKISRCGIEFEDVEIIPQKNERAFFDLLRKRSIAPDQFVMIGNSFKSDILPVLNIGAKAVYVKSEWQFERVDDSLTHPNLYRSEDLSSCIQIINQIENEEY